MRRREFVALLGGAAAWPVIMAAQERARPRKIEVLLIPYSEGDTSMVQRIAALLDGLAAHGWTDGQTIAVKVHPGSFDLIRQKATVQQVVASSPDLIVAQGNPVVAALQNIDHRIPTVFIQVGDPVGSGFVSSLSRPGGNVTGFSAAEPSIGGKWLEILRELAPSISHVGVLFDEAITANLAYLQAVESAAQTHTIGISRFAIKETASIEHAFSSVARLAHAVILLPSPATGSTPHRELIAQLAAEYRLPTIGSFRYLPASGCLASYGPDVIDLFRRGVSYCDRILKGEKPADLPVQAPTKYELVINSKTAKAIGLTIPPSLLARADEVIE